MNTPQEIQQMQDGAVDELLTLRRKVKELEQIHQLDMAEIIMLRRMIDIKEENVNEGIQGNG